MTNPFDKVTQQSSHLCVPSEVAGEVLDWPTLCVWQFTEEAISIRRGNSKLNAAVYSRTFETQLVVISSSSMRLPYGSSI